MGLHSPIPLTGAPGQLLRCGCWECSTIPSCPCSSEELRAARSKATCNEVVRGTWLSTCWDGLSSLPTLHRGGPPIRANVPLTCLGSGFRKAGLSLVIVCPHAEPLTPTFGAHKAVISADLRAALWVWQERLSLLHRSIEWAIGFQIFHSGPSLQSL